MVAVMMKKKIRNLKKEKPVLRMKMMMLKSKFALMIIMMVILMKKKNFVQRNDRKRKSLNQKLKKSINFPYFFNNLFNSFIKNPRTSMV